VEGCNAAESLSVLNLVYVKSANTHLMLREEIHTEVEVCQETRAETDWQGWRSLASGVNGTMSFLSRYIPKYGVEVMLLSPMGRRADELRRMKANGVGSIYSEKRYTWKERGLGDEIKK
jgi:hypothetical protein